MARANACGSPGATNIPQPRSAISGIPPTLVATKRVPHAPDDSAWTAVEVYWFDDAPNGGCRAPQSWKLSYRVGESWLPVEYASECTTELDKYNRVTFRAVETTGLRIEAQLQPNYSAGILEWKVGE